MEEKKISPNPEADKPTPIKRLYADLIGLPPSPEEVNAFVYDHSADAYEKVVDHLLASPHYGERMALEWLDAARYADSNGFQQDGDTYPGETGWSRHSIRICRSQRFVILNASTDRPWIVII